MRNKTFYTIMAILWFIAGSISLWVLDIEDNLILGLICFSIAVQYNLAKEL